jgi:hypothetical protein
VVWELAVLVAAEVSVAVFAASLGLAGFVSLPLLQANSPVPRTIVQPSLEWARMAVAPPVKPLAEESANAPKY